MTEKRTARKITPSPSTFLNELADAFGPPPKKEIPASGKSEAYGVPAEILPEDQDQGEDITIRIMARKSWGKSPSKGRNFDVAYPHLSRENPEIKRFADDPLTANRWATVRDGKPYQPRRVNQEADPRWMQDLGSLRECRTALTLLVLDPPITHFAVCPPDGEMVTFPVDPEAKPIELERADNDSDIDSPAEVPTNVPEVTSEASSLGGDHAL